MHLEYRSLILDLFILDPCFLESVIPSIAIVIVQRFISREITLKNFCRKIYLKKNTNFILSSAVKWGSTLNDRDRYELPNSNLYRPWPLIVDPLFD